VTYLLDTMIVSYFLQAQRDAELAIAAKRCPMAIVGEVQGELEKDKTRGGKSFKKWLDGSGIHALAIELGTPAHATLAALVSPASTGKNLGERASIALAAAEASLTFVTNDTKGLRIAVREIWMPGERVLGLEVFLRRLFEQHALDDIKALDDVMAIAVSSPQQPPTWWAAWRASIAAASVPVLTSSGLTTAQSESLANASR
jgi:hypothetical protein